VQQVSADEDVLKVTRFFRKFEMVTESKIPKPGPKTKMQTTDLKRRKKEGENTCKDSEERKGDEEELWEDKLGCYTQMELVREEAVRIHCVNHVICNLCIWPLQFRWTLTNFHPKVCHKLSSLQLHTQVNQNS
jgi:hypothetical protein